MDPAPTTLLELRRAQRTSAPWLVSLVQPEIGGGRLDQAQLAALEERPEARVLKVSGLDQAVFEVLVSEHATRFTAIHFWKCPRITDLTPLEALPDLELVAFYWNQRATRLWDLSRNPRLRGLHFDDFTRLHDLGDLERGGTLTELSFGDAIWSTSVFESLEPLAGLDRLRSLRFDAKKIVDGRIEPLGHLHGLTELAFPSNLFTTRQVAWLRARLPTLETPSLSAVLELSRPVELDGKTRDVRLVGKRKPFLSSVVDEARIRRHVDEFDRQVAEFTVDPSLPPQ
ncbi:MAG: hypothetical protein ACXWK4_13280 [Myxococcaceae bacterium]